MKQLKIEGQQELTGEIKISGAKNIVVALIPAAILCDETATISNVTNIKDVYDLFPSNNPRESSNIDLPAPVSPVNTINPLDKSISRLSISTTFLIDSVFNMCIYYPFDTNPVAILVHLPLG